MPVPVVIAKLGSTIGGKLADLTVGSIGKQIGYVISYRHNLTEHKDALKELKNHRDVVQLRVDEARRQGEEIFEKVKDWISTADEITKNAEELCAKGPQDCSWRSCPNLWLRHQISREAKKMTMRIQNHKDKGKFESVSHFIPPKLLGVPPTSEENDELIESRISIRNQVLEALKDSSRVGMCGLPGVGKTTLARKIADVAEEQKEVFGLVVWVTVAQFSMLEIQKQIAEIAGKKLEKETLNVRAKLILQRLEQEKNVLVVMDDLWERLDLSLVGIPPKCRILFTSRHEKLLSTQMNCNDIFTVGKLSEEEAWKLFKENAEFDESNHTELVPVAKEVCERCRRLPLALVSVARALKKKREVSNWRTARRRLETSLGKYLQAWNKEIGPSLKLSYGYLNSELQSIFLLSAVLSHDPLIKHLLRYAVGLGLLEGAHSMKDAHDTLDEDISDLKDSSLLLDSFSDDRVTMHDLFRDFAFQEQGPRAKRFKGGQGDIEDMRQLEGCTRLVLDEWDGILPGELPCPKLEFFLRNGEEDSDLTIPDNFFKSLNELRAMGFSGVSFSSLPTLGHLQKLRTLCLERCRLEDISQVGNLNSLRVLSFAGSNIRQLPGALAQLRCLQVLDLSRCRGLEVIPPKVLSSLTRLEVLNMEWSFCQWEVEGPNKESRNASLDELRHLTNLYDLNIDIPQNIAVPEDLFIEMPLERFMIFNGHARRRMWMDNGCSRTLGMCSVNLDDEMQKLLGKVQDLCLHDVNVKTNVLGGTVFRHQSVGLEHLEVVGCKSIKAIVGSTNKDSTDAIVFDALRSLNLRDLPMLSAFHEQEEEEEEEINAKSKSLFNSKISFQKIEKLDLRELNRTISSIWDGQLPENSFTNLNTLKVVNCGFAGRLVPFHVLKSLKHLEKVVVKYCDMLEVVFDFEELKGEEIQSPALISVPLKKLSLYKLPELKHVWSNWPPETVPFPCLEEVEIKECERLTSMFPSTEFQEEYPLFPHQKVVQNMKSLTCDGKFAKMVWDGQIPNDCFSNVEDLSLYLDGDDESVTTTFPRGLYKSKFPNLQRLVLKGYMKELISSSSSSRPKPPLDDEVGASFTTLIFDKMYNLEHIWDESAPPVFLLQNLQTLRVSHCPDLINLGTSYISFTNLTEIQVSYCGKMMSLLTSLTSRALVQLTRLTISCCEQMKEVVAEQQLLEKNDDNLSGKEIIVFQKLEYLKLDDLPSLRSFCNSNYSF
ncbi:unnamed protein product [Cuscuta campestris]|uniref:AAA+ ATPase domain-containing protein n=1 Tax=Cuscuta campestris TaxID=132261 RepID=A0A484MGA7_9ASTE|nr:unnamed protein product [Cuscuta campestris]